MLSSTSIVVLLLGTLVSGGALSLRCAKRWDGVTRILAVTSLICSACSVFAGVVLLTTGSGEPVVDGVTRGREGLADLVVSVVPFGLMGVGGLMAFYAAGALWIFDRRVLEASAWDEDSAFRNQVILDFATCLQVHSETGVIRDVSELPHSKTIILEAYKTEVLSETNASRQKSLREVATLLVGFQEGVGTTPLTAHGGADRDRYEAYLNQAVEELDAIEAAMAAAP